MLWRRRLLACFGHRAASNYWGRCAMRLFNPKVMRLTFGAGLAITASTIAALATTLTDNTFGSVTTISHPGAPDAVINTLTPCPSCGNPPGAGLQATADYTAATASGSIISAIGFIDTSLSYNPSTLGSIAAISVSYDRLVTSNFGTSIGLTVRLIIEQGGNDYVTAINDPGTDFGDVWHNLSVSGLKASNFSLFNFATGVGGSAHPDFGGSQITFGIAALLATEAGEMRTANYDNLNIDIAQTPLPATLPLFATGLGALGLFGWRRKRKTAALAA